MFRNLLIADSGKVHVEEMIRMLQDIPSFKQVQACKHISQVFQGFTWLKGRQVFRHATGKTKRLSLQEPEGKLRRLALTKWLDRI